MMTPPGRDAIQVDVVDYMWEEDTYEIREP